METLQRKPVVVRLADGPCAGSFATIASYGDEIWQKLGAREQVWVQYVKNLYQPGEFVFAGRARTTDEHAAAIAGDSENTYGMSGGA
jgi:hypothetical protein